MNRPCFIRFLLRNGGHALHAFEDIKVVSFRRGTCNMTDVWVNRDLVTAVPDEQVGEYARDIERQMGDCGALFAGRK